MTKKIAIAIFFAVLIGTFVVRFAISNAVNIVEEKDDSMSIIRPENIPQDAVFRGGPDGGFFIYLKRRDLLLEDGINLPAYKLGVYWPGDGEIEFDGIGIFVSDREISSEGIPYYHEPPALNKILSTAYFNGGELEFEINGIPNAGRIIPLNSQFLN